MPAPPPLTGPRADPYDVNLLALARAVPVKRILICAAAALAALYLGDFTRFHIRRDKFAGVTVARFYAVSLKGDKTDFQPAGSDEVQCAKSLFPHCGCNPCWYVKRHKNVRIDI